MGRWSNIGSMGEARYCHTASVLSDGKVLVVGGYNNIDDLGTTELYNPSRGRTIHMVLRPLAMSVTRVSMLNARCD